MTNEHRLAVRKLTREQFNSAFGFPADFQPVDYVVFIVEYKVSVEYREEIRKWQVLMNIKKDERGTEVIGAVADTLEDALLRLFLIQTFGEYIPADIKLESRRNQN